MNGLDGKRMPVNRTGGMECYWSMMDLHLSLSFAIHQLYD